MKQREGGNVDDRTKLGRQMGALVQDLNDCGIYIYIYIYITKTQDELHNGSEDSRDVFFRNEVDKAVGKQWQRGGCRQHWSSEGVVGGCDINRGWE